MRLNRVFIKVILFLIINFYFLSFCFAQVKDLEFNLDINSKTTPLPLIFSPSIDLSGRGYHSDVSWPAHLADKNVLSRWQSEIGFNKGFFRLYFDLWEIEKLKNDPFLRKAIFDNYEKIIKNISEAKGKIILVLYGTPSGLAEVLDKRAFPSDLKSWQSYIKEFIRYFSCQKRYDIWYEVWSSPESEDFFLGTKNQYLELYKAVAEVIKELEKENKIHIPLGGPGVSSWFKNFEENSIFYPERSLIYELIKFCSQKKLPLDFISWHAFSDDPLAEKEITIYGKYPAQIIRDWLSFFHLDIKTPLIITEWNYDSGSNWDEMRSEKSYVVSSFIPARLKSMFEAGLDAQIYFCLEDFQNNKEGININRGVFSYSLENPYLSNAKSIYNLYLFLNQLGDKFYGCFSLDDFVQVLATARDSEIILLISNYIDPHIGRNYIFRNLSKLNQKDIHKVVQLYSSLKLDEVIIKKIDLNDISDRLKNMFKEASKLQEKKELFKDKVRYIKINLNNLKGSYIYQRYSINSGCNWDCSFLPIEEKIIDIQDSYQENLELAPYSVELIILRKE